MSPTLFGWYINKVTDYITSGGSKGFDILGTHVHILLYADGIILVLESHAALQHHFDSVDRFRHKKDS